MSFSHFLKIKPKSDTYKPQQQHGEQNFIDVKEVFGEHVVSAYAVKH
jgi:hypothetical protein